MEPDRIGPLRVRAVGDGHGPAILLCHGFGGPGDELVPLARFIDAGPDVRWFFPEAPLNVQLASRALGRAWWRVDPAQADRPVEEEETPEGLADARAALEATLASLEEDHGITRDRLILGGFAQGAMLATEIALHSSRPFAGLAILSGALISSKRWAEAARIRRASLHVFQAHGLNDTRLPFEASEALRRMLVKAGASVDWAPHAGDHEIPDPVVARLGAFARSRFGVPERVG